MHRLYVQRQTGWRLGPDFQDVMSGRKTYRPQYQACLAEAKRLAYAGHKVAIVVAALGRMGRNLAESARTREEFKKYGIGLHCVREGGELSDLHANILSSIAADEADRIRSRVVGSRQRNRQHGFRSTSPAPWGYVWAENDPAAHALAKAPKSILTPNPLTAPYVVEAWKRVAAGESVRAVGRWVVRLTREARGGRALHANNLYSIFKNPTYIVSVAARE